MSERLPNDIFARYSSVVFFDTETTGFHPESDHVVEVAAMRFDRNERDEWVQTKSMSDLIVLPEGVKMPPEATKVNNITDEMLVKDGKTKKEVMSAFADIIDTDEHGDKTLLIGYNTFFDYSFMKYEFNDLINKGLFSADRQGAIIDNVVTFDPLLTARERICSANDEKVSHKLGDMLKYYGITDAQNSHRAMGDVEALISLSVALHNERNDLTQYDTFPCYKKYGPPKNHEVIMPSAKFKTEDELLGKTTRRIKGDTVMLERHYVPDEVMTHINMFFENSNGLKNYTPVFVERYSNSPADNYLYQVIAKNNKTNEYACWSCWNESTQCLNYGNYNLPDFRMAKEILNDKYFDAYAKFPYNPKQPPIEAVIDRVAEFYVEKFTDGKEPDMQAYNKCYQSLYADLDSKSWTDLAYTTVTNDKIPVQAFIDLHSTTTRLVIDGKIAENNRYYSNSDLLSKVSFDPCDLVNLFEEDVDKYLTGLNLAEAYQNLKDTFVYYDEKGQMYNAALAKDIYDHPNTFAEEVKRIAEEFPGRRLDAQNFLHAMDIYCEMDERPITFGFYKKAEEVNMESRHIKDPAGILYKDLESRNDSNITPTR